MKNELEIDILCDNLVFKDGCIGEWGLSLLVNFKNKKILFDTGYSFVFEHNAKNENIDLNKIDFLVLSHFHDDHSGGLRYIKFKNRKKIIIHPQILEKLPKNEAKNVVKNFKVIASKKPLEFEKDVVYLGEIPRKNNFEKGIYKDDSMKDDSAIIIKTEKGVVVISGCSHSGICNICEYAKKVSGQKLLAVIGGFHLLDEKENVDKTIKYFQKENIKHLIPLHCILPSVFEKFNKIFGCKKYTAADKIEIC